MGVDASRDEALSHRLARVAAKLAAAATLPGEPVMFGAKLIVSG